LFVTFYGTIYMMIISILGAYALSKERLFGHKVLNFLLVFTMWFAAGMIPVWLNYVDTWNIMSKMGIRDTKWLVVIAMGFSAFNIIILRNAFQAVPKEIEEAATVDGANEFQIMSKVYVPMSKASVATVALFYGISRWNGYFWAKRMTDSSYDNPLQVYIRDTLEYSMNPDNIQGWSGIHNYAPDSFTYSMIVCAIIPVLIIYPFIQKYFAAGVNLGGVKE
jgi:putative aldouronate transport system permease protein